MEILSTGKKIKRARIYKGLTLKELCGDKISVSKLSCIENEKIEAEDEILEYISKKLNLEYSYLVQDIKSQIRDNVEEAIKNQNDVNFIDKLNYNFEIANEYKYYELAFEILHLIFSYYIKEKDFKNCHMYLKKYYKASANISKRGELLFSDVGDFIYLNKEYSQALNFYNATLEVIKNKDEEESKVLMYEVIIKKCFCLIYIGKTNEARKELDIINYGIEYIEDKVIKAKNYGILAYFNSDSENLAKAYMDMGIDIVKNDRVKLIEILKEYVRLFKTPNMKYLRLYCCDKMVELNSELNGDEKKASMMSIIKVFYEDNVYKKVLKLCDECLNDLEDDEKEDSLREKLYYYKAKTLDSEEQYISAELFYNLSIELLIKANDLKNLNKRYMELGNLYYKMNNVNESVKYLNLAMEV